MTKAELVEALDMYFDDDEVIVCADESGGWDNIQQLGRVGGTAAIIFGGGSPFRVSKLPLSARIRELEMKHGGLRAVARLLNCDAAYLLRLRNGEKCNPSAAMLRKLGLQKAVTYVRCDYLVEE